MVVLASTEKHPEKGAFRLRESPTCYKSRRTENLNSHINHLLRCVRVYMVNYPG